MNRRGFLKVLGAGAGALFGGRLVDPSGVKNAFAATEPASVVMIHFYGGYSAIFSSADSLSGKFNVTADNFSKFGPVGMDNTLANALTPFAQNHVATIGVRHGITSHQAARRATYNAGGGECTALRLAAAMGGNAPIKAATIGKAMPNANTNPVDGVSLQPIQDLKSTLEALGATSTGGGKSPAKPEMIAGVGAAQALSQRDLVRHGTALGPLADAYASDIAMLKNATNAIDIGELSGAYGLSSSAVNDFKSQLAGAEMMVRTGSNFVLVSDQFAEPNWDYHGDNTQNRARNRMRQQVQDPLKVFLRRMLNRQDRNVVVAILGDFSRNLTADHQPNLSATVLGKYVKNGTTGRVDGRVGLPAGTPSFVEFWSYLAAAAKVQTNPFGTNPHGLIL